MDETMIVNVIMDIGVIIAFGFSVVAVMLFRIGSEVKKIRTGDYDHGLGAFRKKETAVVENGQKD